MASEMVKLAMGELDPEDDQEGDAEDAGPDIYESAAEQVLSAVKDGDAKMLASALRDIVEMAIAES